MSVSPNTEMVRSDLTALVTAANTAASAGKILHGPFYLFNPGTPTNLNDRGGWAAGTYAVNDLVNCDGYYFVSVTSSNTDRPLDATTGDPSSAWAQPWYSCYQRIRDEVKAGANANSLTISGSPVLTQYQQAVSGPWPCQSPSIDYNDLAFYFEDTGHTENVTLTSGTHHFFISSGKVTLTEEELLTNFYSGPPVSQDIFPVKSLDPSGSDPIRYEAHTGPSVGNDADGNPVIGQYIIRYASAVEVSFIIGGTEPVDIDATFELDVRAWKGWGILQKDYGDGSLSNGTGPVTDSDDPTTMFDVDTSDWLPGQTFTKTFGGWSDLNSAYGAFAKQLGSVTTACVVSGTFDPGTYTVRLAINRGPNNQASGTLTIDSGASTITGFNQWNYQTFVTLTNQLQINGSISLTESGGVEVPAIDDTVRVLKIALPVFDSNGIPSGIYGVNSLYQVDNPTPPPSTILNDLIYSGFIIPGTNLATIGGDPLLTVDLDTATFPALTYVKDVTGLGLRFTTITASTTGYWMGITPPVRSLGMLPDDKMPWNIFPTTLPSSGAKSATTNKYLGYTLPYVHSAADDSTDSIRAYGTSDSPGWLTPSVAGELLPWPKRWKANVHYPKGFVVIDSNGNFQTILFDGKSGATEPVWQLNEGDVTIESVTHSSWQMTKQIENFHPPVARISPPIYPFFWHNPVSQWAHQDWQLDDEITDSNGNTQRVITAGTSGLSEPSWSTSLNSTTIDGTAAWKLVRLEQPDLTDPNTSPVDGSHPFSFKPQGWCIYRVFLNRIPQSKSIVKPSSTPISVELGCVRSGSFVSFGTYSTGTPVDAMWFVFTNTALAYRCAERLDVQSEILTCGLGYDLWGSVSYPMAAAHINDVETIMAML